MTKLLEENREFIRILFNEEIGCTEEEFNKAFDMTMEDIRGNQQVLADLKETHVTATTLNYIRKTMLSSLGLLKGLN